MVAPPRCAVLLVFIAFAVAACGEPSIPENQGGGAIVTDAKPWALRVPGWLELRDLTLHTDAEIGPPNEPYVRGSWIGSMFDATGGVVGTTGPAPKGRKLTRGWLDLRTRAFFRTDDPHRRAVPSLDGWRDEDTGGFHAAADVVWSPP